jgi:hypothetical protein
MSKPQRTESFAFVSQGGMTCIKGNPYWPTLLNMDVSRDEALELIARIARQLQNESRDRVDLAMMGKLVQNSEDGFDWPT